MRRSLETWFEANHIHPKVVAECDDNALIMSLGQAKVGFFISPTIVGKEVVRQYKVREVGCLDGLTEKFYAVSIDRKIEHPAVKAIVNNAKSSIFKG